MSAPATAVLRAIIPDLMEPGARVFSLLLVWVCSYALGEAFELCRLPKALGMLVAGLILSNLPAAGSHAHHLDAPENQLVAYWNRQIRAGAMALVLLRAGLSLELSKVRGYGWRLPVMATLPSCIEAFAGAAIASRLFGMPYALALVMSFMVSAVGPAIVVSGCSSAKEAGFAPAAPNFLTVRRASLPPPGLAAASALARVSHPLSDGECAHAQTVTCFDDATCIIGFNCALHAFINTGGDPVWNYLIGPMNLILGLVGGLVGAGFCAATCLWSNSNLRTSALFLTSMLLIFVAESQNLLGAGAISNIVLGIMTRHLWQLGWPRRLVSAHHAAACAADPGVGATPYIVSCMKPLNAAWYRAFYPLLFGLIGASLNTKKVDPHIGTLALAYAAIAVVLRFAAASCVASQFRDFKPGERIFMACAWVAKATTQAAFATVPGDALKQWVKQNPGETFMGYNAAQLLSFGVTIQTCCVISIFLGTPVATLLMGLGAPYLLDKAPRRSASDSAAAVAASVGADPGSPGSVHESVEGGETPGSALGLSPSALSLGSVTSTSVDDCTVTTDQANSLAFEMREEMMKIRANGEGSSSAAGGAATLDEVVVADASSSNGHAIGSGLPESGGGVTMVPISSLGFETPATLPDVDSSHIREP